MVRAIEEQLRKKIIIPTEPQIMAVLGAAFLPKNLPKINSELKSLKNILLLIARLKYQRR